MEEHILGRVPESPTLPGAPRGRKKFDVADLYGGAGAVQPGTQGLDEKLRKAYFWMTNYAIITPFYDIEYSSGKAPEYRLGDSRARLTLPDAQSYSSFVLLPLLNLVARRRCLFIGGPGRGKTASAVFMGLLAGYTPQELKRAIQHGQPQMTISDLLGNPIPSDLMNREDFSQIRIAWRKWLSMRVKIIDEYNRIPTRTQSALLTVMGDNYAELLDQVYECPEAAWYLTANDDAGGGTYQVIEALRDRIDVVVHALHFNTRFYGELLGRIDARVKPENMVPRDVIFTEEEIDQAYGEILDVEIPAPLMKRLEYFAAQFEFFEPGGEIFEYRTKDNVKLSGAEMQSLAGSETGKDRLKDLGLQTRNGLSVRAVMTSLIFLKAMAYFRGADKVDLDDMRNILPFVLHDKLAQNPDAPFFDQPGNSVYRVDRIGWIRRLFDLSNSEYDKLGLEQKDPVAALEAEFARGLEGLGLETVRSAMVRIEQTLETMAAERKLSGPVYDSVLKLKYLHQRYSNYARWLQWKA